MFSNSEHFNAASTWIIIECFRKVSTLMQRSVLEIHADVMGSFYFGNLHLKDNKPLYKMLNLIIINSAFDSNDVILAVIL